MDDKFFPRNYLDKSIHNPDLENSISVAVVDKSDQEIVDYVVSQLKNTGTK